MNSALIGVFAGVISGIAIKLIDTYALPKAKKVDIGTEIRDELRGEIQANKTEISDVRAELDYWKKSYFKVIEMLIKTNVDIPDYLFEPYRKDPSTPNTPNKHI